MIVKIVGVMMNIFFFVRKSLFLLFAFMLWCQSAKMYFISVHHLKDTGYEKYYH